MLAEDRRHTEGRAVSESISLKGKAVYVIDDDSMVRRAIYLFLKSSGYTPRSFRSGRDFLEEFDELLAGVVLLDLRMPDLNGLEVLKHLGHRIARFPVVMITGHGEVSAAVSAMKLGAIDFVEKPFSELELLDIIEKIFAELPDVALEESRRADAAERFGRLTRREIEVVQGIVDGLSNKLIAFRLGISPRTVEVHRANLMERLQLSSLAEVVRMALMYGMQPSSDTQEPDTAPRLTRV